MGLLNKVEILAWAPPAIAKNTCHCSSIDAKSSRIPLSLFLDSFQERKHKNFQVESDPFIGNLLKETLIGLTKPGRNFGLGASRNSKKPLSLQLNCRKIRPEFRSAWFWTVIKSANTKIFRLNPTLFLVTF